MNGGSVGKRSSKRKKPTRNSLVMVRMKAKILPRVWCTDTMCSNEESRHGGVGVVVVCDSVV